MEKKFLRGYTLFFCPLCNRMIPAEYTYATGQMVMPFKHNSAGILHEVWRIEPWEPLPESMEPVTAQHKSRRCPTCDSPDPKRHPAVQWEGEVQWCKDAWHRGA
jgi:hypothetical protein